MLLHLFFFFFFFNDTATTEIYTLSYTTLFRSLVLGPRRAAGVVLHPHGQAEVLLQGRPHRQLAHRSEEHTSELQSLAYLVCRLLLEKKKNTHATVHVLAQQSLQRALLSLHGHT